MKFKVLPSLVMLGAAVALVGVGCGDDSAAGGGGNADGGNASGGNADGGNNPVTNSTTTMSGGGGATGDGNDTLETADPMDEENGVSSILGDLDPADGDIDFFSFNGLAGPVWIASDAKPDDDPFGEGYPDLVLTLFNAAGDQIAQNDDPFPTNTQDSNFYTILPEDGTYYISVQEFCFFAAPGTCDQDYFDNLTDTAFAVNVLPIDPADDADGIAPEAAEENELQADATVNEYTARDDVGVYYLSLTYGEWQTDGDTDGLLMTVPADLAITAGSRGSAGIIPPPPGTDGNGSSTNPGIITVVDVAAPTVVVARFDFSNESNGVQERAAMDFPVTPGATYLLTTEEGPIAPTGDVPFYFLLHTIGEGNPVEEETLPLSNDTFLTAETPASSATTGGTSFFIEGNLGTADVDYFKVGPVDDETLTVTCSSLRSGSGANGFKATVFEEDGTTAIANGSKTETAAEGGDLLIENLPTGANTQMVIRLEKGTQDATNPADYYRCGFHFRPTPP